MALLLLLVVVAALYVGPARSLLGAWQDSNAKQAEVRELSRQHDALVQRARALRDPLVVEAEARRLGMVRPGERPYVVSNLPDD